jgi:ATP-dependent DNA helicase RecG
MAECGVQTVAHLLFLIPKRYEDRTQLVSLDEPLVADRWILVRGRVSNTDGRRSWRRRLAVVTGVLGGGRRRIPVVWFNQPWMARRLADAGEVTLYGPIRRTRQGVLELVNPELTEVDPEVSDERIVPVYPGLGSLGGRRLRAFVEQCLPALDDIDDPMPEPLLEKQGMPNLRSAVQSLHSPDLPEDEEARARLVRDLNCRRTPAHRRLAFDELVVFACGLERHRSRRALLNAPKCRVGEGFGAASARLLPYQLTGAQQRVLAEIARDLGADAPMARLIQGDVGSGKTVVAMLAMLMMVEAGHQAALMAPTELLSEQHFKTLEGFFSPTQHRVGLLTSSLSAIEQNGVRAALEDGSAGVVVGTHALFQESVRFADLGLVVIDEQHRFGVGHRQALVAKGRAPHVLVMTATPIPRSLALTIYGDLDVSLIDELPPGRRPVTTVLRGEESRSKLMDFVRREVREGGRAFFVYPMIEANDEVAAPALEEQLDTVKSALQGVRVGVLHGRMTRVEREAVAREFAEGGIQVLLATTVVEVGVDVPEASVMVIEAAGRFGLSQLHQLRGRVGRGHRRAWCVLMTDQEVSDDARRRLDVVSGTSDGFEIAEADLEMRGPGELTGTRQWGPAAFRFANLIRHADLLAAARNAAATLESEGRLEDVREGLGRYHPLSVEVPIG